MTIVALLLVVPCLIAWVALVATVFHLHDSDAAGNGMAQAFAAIVAVALWALVALFAVAAGIAAGLGVGGAALWAIVAIPAAGAGTVAAVMLLSRRAFEARWPLVLPVVAPGLALALVGANLFAATRGLLPPAAAHAGWATLLALSLLPWPAVRRRGAETAD